MSTPADRVRRLRNEGDPLAHRRRIGTRPCEVCGAPADVYDDDPRARGWLRTECPACGVWGDAEPSERAAIVAGAQ